MFTYHVCLAIILEVSHNCESSRLQGVFYSSDRRILSSKPKKLSVLFKKNKNGPCGHMQIIDARSWVALTHMIHRCLQCICTFE